MSIKDRILGRQPAPVQAAPESPAADRDMAAPPPRVVPPAPAAANGADAAPMRPKSTATQEQDWKRRIHEQLLRTLDFAMLATLEESVARPRVREAAEQVIADTGVPLPAAVRLRLAKEVEDEILGLGPLETIMEDNAVTDILVNGYSNIYVERRGRLTKTDLQFRDEAHLRHIIDRIVSRVGRRIDEFSPMVDARLPDGSRVNAVIPPLALDGSLLSIRRFGKEDIGIPKLIEFGTLTPEIAEVLRCIVHAGLNVLISGGTGSGKTTMLNAISVFIPEDERIVTIEDAAELKLQQPHVARLETRPPNIEGTGAVTQRDLVRNALRMRPDRIILGEVRAGEAFDMLQAMNTGHDGSLTTIHANTPRDAISRVENMVAMAGFDMPITSVRRQIASGIHIVMQVERLEDGRRRMTSLQEIQGMEGDVVTMGEIFTFRREGLDKEGMVIGKLRATGLVPAFYERIRSRGLELSRDVFNPNRKER